MRQVYHVPSPPLVRGTPGSATYFRRPFVGREQDGSETVYTTLEEARRGERERVEGSPLPEWAQRRLAEKNVAHMRRYQGLLPGTDAARFCAAIEEKV